MSTHKGSPFKKQKILLVQSFLHALFEQTQLSPAAVVSLLYRKRMAATELSKSMNEFLTKLQDDLKEAMNTMMCTKCEGKHKYVAKHLQISVNNLFLDAHFHGRIVQ